MRLPGRLSAAIEVLADVETRHRPVAEALKAWGLNNRFAGAGEAMGPSPCGEGAVGRSAARKNLSQDLDRRCEPGARRHPEIG